MSTSAIKHYVDQFEHLQNELINDHLHEQRQSAIELLQKTGFPTTRQENWKYTDVRPITGKLFNTTPVNLEKISSSTLENIRLHELDCHELVFINGRYSAEHSSFKVLPGGVVINDLASALKDHNQLISEHISGFSETKYNGFTALNTAFIRDGAFICLPPDTVIEKPISLLYLSGLNDQSFASHPRNLIILSENSQATVIESYIGLDDSDYFSNTVTEVCMKQNARLQHYKIQQESMRAYHIGSLKITQKRNSQVESHSFSLGGALVRNDIHSLLEAEGAGIRMNGLYMATGKQHVDNHTRVDHLQPHTNSHEIYRGVLNDHARGVFNGKVVVHKDAQKTDAVQSNANLLLSDNAEVDTKPELEIYADDVKCAHGATVGQLDQDMLFYLRSRSIDENTAKSLLTFAFADEVISRINLDPIRKRLEYLVIGRLPEADLIREFAA
jgi:Fe-S cluster assembly protein SufD